MVFVFVVVLEVVGTMMFAVPSFDHHTLISFGGGLEEFLDFRCDLMVHQEVQKNILI
jgi:hypothetical protein